MPIMSAPVAQNSGPMPAGSAQGGQIVPFVRAAAKAVQVGEAKSTTLTTAVQTQQHIIPAVSGWNRRIVLKVVCVTAGNGNAVTAAADGPWNVLANILLKDANQKQLINLPGYYAYLADTRGGYSLFRPDAGARAYSFTTGAGATGGSFTFFLELHQEFGRDGYGSYQNRDASQRLTLDLSISAAATPYGVAPTNAGTVTITPTVYYYAMPPATENGEVNATMPPANGTTQYWRFLTQTANSGANVWTFNLSGRHIRNAWLVWLDNAGTPARSDTVSPDSLRVELDNTIMYDAPTDCYDADTWRRYGVDNPTGFVPLLLGTLDPDNLPSGEWGDGWWRTTTASQLVVRGTTGAAGQIVLILNEIEPTANIFRYGG